MPISSDIFSVDTIQIRPVEDALLQGRLVMPAGTCEMMGNVAPPWGSYVINMVMVCLCVLIFIFQLRRNLRIVPYLLEGLFRSKKLLDLEEGVRLIRDRNSLSVNAVLILVLVSSRYGLFRPSYMDGFCPGMQTLLILVAFILILLFRHLMIVGMSRYMLEGELYQLNNRIANDYVIVMAYTVLLMVGLLSLFGISAETIRTVSYYAIAVIYGLFLLRRSQILSGSCAQLPAILYLCILEILPAGLLVATEILF